MARANSADVTNFANSVCLTRKRIQESDRRRLSSLVELIDTDGRYVQLTPMRVPKVNENPSFYGPPHKFVHASSADRVGDFYGSFLGHYLMQRNVAFLMGNRLNDLKIIG